MRSFKNKIVVITLLLGFIGLWLGSCTDEDLGGTPAIHYIRIPDPASSDSILVKGLLGNVIAIVGENLGGVREIWFNDQRASLSPTYVTERAVLVPIPGEAPGEVTDKMRLVFSDQFVLEYDFSIDIPAPVLQSMKSEWVQPGGTATLRGNYFFEPITVTLANGATVTPSDVTQSQIEFIVPENATPGPITVATNFGEITSSFHFLDRRGLFATMDSTTSGWWHGADKIKTDPDIPQISGNYLLVEHDVTGAGDWYEFLVAPADSDIRKGTANIPAEAIADPRGYLLKFEVNTKTPFVNGSQIKIYIGNDMSGQRGTNFYKWNPFFDTKGEWETVSIPFDDVMASIPVSVNPAGYGVSFWFHEGVAMPAYFAVDNLRVVKSE